VRPSHKSNTRLLSYLLRAYIFVFLLFPRSFWNDEGEDDYFTFTEWSAAQAEGLKSFDPSRRYFSINRAFSPGAASLGAIAWTVRTVFVSLASFAHFSSNLQPPFSLTNIYALQGDIHDTWEDLTNTPGYFLNWGVSGQPWVTCDTGGFAGDEGATLLTRWYGVASLMPVMRVHSTLSSPPHFPFPELWGTEASDAMRVHLNRRYALLPYTYSLGYVTHSEGVPIARPLAMMYPSDQTVRDLTSQWMLGEGLLVAPVLNPNNSTSPYLPAGVWYAWGTNTQIVGPQTLSLTGIPLDNVPMYALAGSIIPTAQQVQFSDALPGGPLNVNVYSGADGLFILYEDDGETIAYSDPSNPAYTATTFTWDDSTGCLTWTRGGVSPNPAGTKAFTQLMIYVFDIKGNKRSAAPLDIQQNGKDCPVAIY